MDLEKEFKKLSYALGSYKKCGFKADYEHNKDERSYTFLLLDKGEMPVIAHKVPEDFDSKELEKFKKDSIKKCSHA